MSKTYDEYRKLVKRAVDLLIDLTEPNQHPVLIEMAYTGRYTPLDFVNALRHIPGYDEKQAPNMEAQYFNSNGWPMTDEEVARRFPHAGVGYLGPEAKLNPDYHEKAAPEHLR